MVELILIVGCILLFLLVRSAVTIWRHATRYDQELRAYWEHVDTWGTRDRHIAASDLRTSNMVLNLKMRKGIMYCVLLLMSVLWGGVYFLLVGGVWQSFLLLVAVIIWLVGIKRSAAFRRRAMELRFNAAYLVSTLYQGLVSNLTVRDIFAISIARGPRSLRPFLRRCCLQIDQGDRVSTAFREVCSPYHLVDYSFLVVFFEIYEDMGDVAVRMLQEYDVFVTARQKVDGKWRRGKLFFILFLGLLLVMLLGFSWWFSSQQDVDLQSSLLLVWQVEWARHLMLVLLGVIVLIMIIFIRIIRAEL